MKAQEFFNIINDIDERFVNEVRDDIVQPRAAYGNIQPSEIYADVRKPQRLRAERFTPKMLFKPIMCGAVCLAMVGAILGFAKTGVIRFTSVAPAQSGKPDAVLSNSSLDDNSAVKWIRDCIYSGFDGVHSYFQKRYENDSDSFNINHICFLDGLHFEEAPKSSSSSPAEIHTTTFEYIEDCLVLDFDYAPGSDIYAIDGGVVVYADSLSSGNLIIIKHDNNDYSAYGFLRSLLVKEGDYVKNGDVIAKSDSARNRCGEAGYDTTILRLDREISWLDWQFYSTTKFQDIQNNMLSGDDLQNYYDIHYGEFGQGCKIYGMSSFYSGRDGYSKDYRPMNLKYNIGGDIFAISDGVVTYAGASDFGDLVIIKHDGYYTGYGYLDEVLVNEGDPVKADDVIAKSGSARNYNDTLDYDITILIFYQELTLDNWNCFADLILHEPAEDSITTSGSSSLH